MRRILIALPLLILAVMAAGILGGQWLDAERRISRELRIEAPIAEVYARVGRIRGWEGWYVPPDGGATFEGPEEGAGGQVVVRDDKSGALRMLELTETSSPTLVRYRFPEESGMPFQIDGRFELEPVEGATLVRSEQHLVSMAKRSQWTRLASERWFLQALSNSLIGSILERELHNLKSAVEGLPPPGQPGFEPNATRK